MLENLSGEELFEGHENNISKKNKEKFIGIIVDLIDQTGGVSNAKKLRNDFINRERQSTTAIGDEIAIPHVRSKQMKKTVICFIKVTNGVDYQSPDGKYVKIFFILAAPPYDDKVYLNFYRWISIQFRDNPSLKEELMAAENENEIIRLFKNVKG